MSDSKITATATAASATPSRKRGSKDKEDEDTLSILQAFLDFKTQHGGNNPTPTTITPILGDLNPSLHHKLTADQLYNKCRHLKSKYRKLADAGGPSGRNPFDATFFEIAAKIWAAKSSDLEETPKKKKKKKVKVENGNGHQENGIKEEAEDDEDEDIEEEEEEERSEDADGENGDFDGDGGGGDDGDDMDGEVDLKHFSKAMRGFWGENGLPVEELKLGLRNMNKKAAKKLEEKWREHIVEEMEIKARRIELQKETIKAVIAGWRKE